VGPRDILHYRILDASSGLIEQGHAQVASLIGAPPWADAEAGAQAAGGGASTGGACLAADFSDRV